MKPIYAHLAGALALTFTLAACVPSTVAPPPPPAPDPRPSAAPARPAPAPPAPRAWIDNPRTPGDWSYAQVAGGTIARYSAGGAPVFAIGCDTASRRVMLTREGVTAGPGGGLTIRTETADRTLPATRNAAGTAASAQVAAREPLLDAIALTRGRFAVELAGTPNLYLPNWAEVSRVIEDCR